MLDELLGRAALKERIAELEAATDRLSGQLEGERTRRREAVRDRQAADERANRLEDRIADLEGQVDRARAGERVLEFRGRETLAGGRLAEVLDRLDSVATGPEGALTAMVGDTLPGAVREAFGERAALVSRAAPCLAVTDDAGLVSAALDPPLAPDPFVEWGEGFRVPAEWFLPTGRFGFALVRSDLFAYADYDGGERGGYEGFESDVMGAHSKGGFSQARFERRREEQVDDHLDRARRAIDDRDPDRLIVVGERSVLSGFDDADATAAVDATGDPEEALADAFDAFFSSELYLV